MVKKIFYIDASKTSNITVFWKGNLKTGTVEKDGVLIGVFNNKDEFNRGKVFTLPNKDKVFVQVDETSWIYIDFTVLYNGKPTINERQDPRAYVKSASNVLLGLGAMYFVLGIVFEFVGFIPLGLMPGEKIPEFPRHSGLYVMAFATLYLVAGFWSRARISVIPLHIGLGLLVVQASSIISHLFSNPTSGVFSQTPFIIICFLSYYMVRGINSVKKIKQEQQHIEQETKPSKKKIIS